MRQLHLAILAIGFGFSASRADVQRAPQPAPPIAVATSAKIVPGTYKAEYFSTRFDGEGHWQTEGTGGRYAIDGDVIVFTSNPPACEGESVNYRLRFNAKGFNMQFLADGCGRSGVDINFVRVGGAQVAQ